MQYNGSHRTNYNALVSAGFASHTMLCPGFMLDQPFDQETCTPPIERESSACACAALLQLLLVVAAGRVLLAASNIQNTSGQFHSDAPVCIYERVCVYAYSG